MTNQKWMDIPSKKRHFMLGSIVDGMVYHPECVDDILNLLFTWEKKGLLKSIILPDEHIYFQDETIVDPDEQDEPDNMCTLCNGTGEGCNPDLICISCSGSGVKKINNWDHESF